MRIATTTHRFLPRTSRLAAMLVFCCIGASAFGQPQSLTFNSTVGFPGQGSSDGAGSNAQFYLPAGTAVDASGNVYVADSGNNTIRIVTSTGVVTTIAGVPGITGSTNGIGTNALFNQPMGVAVDAAGNIYVADMGNDTIRKITAGVVATFAGTANIAGSNNATGTNATFNLPIALALDSSTNLYVADYGNNAIRKITPAGAVSTFVGSPGTNGSANGFGTNALFYQPEGIAVDAAGNVYVSDTANATIRKITPGGVASTFAGTIGTNGSVNATGTNAQFYAPLGIGIDHSTNLYVADSFNNTIRKITSAGVVTTFAGAVGTNGSADGTTAARFWGPNGVAVDSSGNVYVGDYYNGTIRKITAGVVSTLAGSPSAGSADGSSANARFSFPLGAAVDTLGNIYIADTANSTIRKIAPNGQTITLAGSPGVMGSADGVSNNASFNSPEAVATDSANNIYVADTGNNTIRKITSSGTVSTFAGTAGVAGNADANGTNAQFFHPEGIVVDPAGNVYVSDTGNNSIRKITSLGAVTTIAGNSLANPGSTDGTGTAALFNTPKGLAVDSSTNIYIADCFNHTIRQLTPTGVSSTLAGWPGIYGSSDGTNNDALFFEPSDLAVDGSGNVYVTDTGNHIVRKITPNGTNWVVTTIGGVAGAPGSANGLGTSIRFDFPAGIALDNSGGIYVVDSDNNTVRLNGSVVVPMVISNVIVTARRNSAILTWATSANGNSQISYGTTPAYGLMLTDSTLTNNHAELLVGLVTNTIYYYQIVSTQGANTATNTGTFSTDDTIIVTALQTPGTSYTGVWINDNSGADRFSSTYRYSSTTTPPDNAQATFRPTIPFAANYDTYIWYSEGPNRSAAAPASVSYQGGSISTTINETVPGGSWFLLAGNEPYAAGTNGFLRLGNGSGEAGKIVIADAARWTYSPSQDLPVNGNVPGWWAQFYFGTTAISSSSLGANGLTLLSDYILGISPFDPNTTLNFNLMKTVNGFQAVFTPYYAGGHSYQLQGTTSLLNPVWTNVPNMTVTANTNGQGVFNLTTLSGAQTFYRLSVQLTP